MFGRMQAHFERGAAAVVVTRGRCSDHDVSSYAKAMMGIDFPGGIRSIT
jgi:hypothetical protein